MKTMIEVRTPYPVEGLRRGARRLAEKSASRGRNPQVARKLARLRKLVQSERQSKLKLGDALVELIDKYQLRPVDLARDLKERANHLSEMYYVSKFFPPGVRQPHVPYTHYWASMRTVKRFRALKLDPMATLREIASLGLTQHRHITAHFAEKMRTVENAAALARVENPSIRGWVNRCHHADFRKIVSVIPDGSVKILLADLPYANYRRASDGRYSAGSVIPSTKRRWINDLNPALVAVYKALKSRPDEFIAACRSIPTGNATQLREAFYRYLNDAGADPAVRYFLLNRCGWNGRVRLDDRWRHRTFFSNPAGWNIVDGDRLQQAAELLRDTRITSWDFERVLDAPGDEVLCFLDPPYVRDTELSESAKLYEKGFSMADHRCLRDRLRTCQHRWVLTYDDHPLIRELYQECFITPASWTYRGNDQRIQGRELVIANFQSEAAVHEDALGLIQPVAA